MKKNIKQLLALAAIVGGFGAAHAEKTYHQVTSAEQLGNGGRYAICPVSSATEAKIIEYNGSSFSWKDNTVATPATFTDNQLWEFKTSAITCNGHTNNNNTFSLNRGQQCLYWNATTAFSVATPNASTRAQGFEFVSDNNATYGNIFRIHAAGADDAGTFTKHIGIQYGGTAVGWSSSTGINSATITSGYTYIYKVYMEFDSDDVDAAAAVLWDGKRRTAAAANPANSALILALQVPSSKTWESTTFEALCTEVATEFNAVSAVQCKIANGNAFKALGIASEETKSAWDNAAAATEWDETALTALTDAYNAMVACSANLSSEVSVRFASAQVSTAYMYITDAKQVKRANSSNGVRDVMTLVPANGGFKIYNEYTGRYVRHATANDVCFTGVDADNASVYKLDVQDAEAGRYGIRLVSNPNPATNYEYLHSNNSGTGDVNVVRWQAGLASSWFIGATEASAVVSQAYTGAQRANCTLVTGNGLGQFNATAFLAAKQTLTDMSADATDTEKLEKSRAVFTAYNSITLNPVPTGKLLQIKYDDTHVYSMTDAYTTFESAADINSIFYYNAENKLENIGKGLAVTVTGTGNNQALNGVSTSAQNTAGTHGHAVTFSGASPNALAANIGKYMVTYLSATNAVRAMSYWTSTDDAVEANAAAAHHVGYGSNVDENNSGHVSWFLTVSEVTELPVAIHADGYGSIVCPVALTAPADATTYLAKAEGEDIKFEEIEEGGVIPAGAHVFIKAEANTTVNVAVATETADGTQYAHDRFNGSHLVKELTPAEGTNVYAKVPVAETGIMTFGATAAEPIKLSKLTADDSGKVTVPAGTAVISLPAALHNDDVISVDPNSGIQTTAITEVNAEAARRDVYDLQGRRLAAPAKGINIIGGKKTLVK